MYALKLEKFILYEYIEKNTANADILIMSEKKQKNLFLINRLNILVAPNISPQIAPKRKQAINM